MHRTHHIARGEECSDSLNALGNLKSLVELSKVLPRETMLFEELAGPSDSGSVRVPKTHASNPHSSSVTHALSHHMWRRPRHLCWVLGCLRFLKFRTSAQAVAG